VDLLDADLVAPGTVATAATGGRELVVWRTLDGEVVVSDARCPHQWSHLAAEGVVDGCELVCLTHWWRFGPDGRGTKLNVKGRRDPKGDLEVFASREHDGRVEVLWPPASAPLAG
jgi:3-ketosteroid 9alpha-monooxygenase subunit A